MIILSSDAKIIINEHITLKPLSLIIPTSGLGPPTPSNLVGFEIKEKGFLLRLRGFEGQVGGSPFCYNHFTRLTVAKMIKQNWWAH